MWASDTARCTVCACLVRRHLLPLHCSQSRPLGIRFCSINMAWLLVAFPLQPCLTWFAALVAALPLRPLRGPRRARGAPLGGPRALRPRCVRCTLFGARERWQRCVRPGSGGTRGAARSGRRRRLDQPLAGRHRAAATPVPCTGRSDTVLTQLAYSFASLKRR